MLYNNSPKTPTKSGTKTGSTYKQIKRLLAAPNKSLELKKVKKMLPYLNLCSIKINQLQICPPTLPKCTESASVCSGHKRSVYKKP